MGKAEVQTEIRDQIKHAIFCFTNTSVIKNQNHTYVDTKTHTPTHKLMQLISKFSNRPIHW